MKSGWLSRVESAALVCCAVTLTGLFVYRDLFPEKTSAASSGARTITEWQAFATSGHRQGPSDAAVTVVEFSDFQCPFCARFNASMRAVLKKHPREVALVYRHFPITQIHSHAMGAALAAECAANQARFDAYRDALFDHQRVIGTRSWVRFAQDAGVPDTSLFARCVADSVPMNRIRSDMRAATRLGVTGTPSILINDKFVAGAPSPQLLEDYISDALRQSRSKRSTN